MRRRACRWEEVRLRWRYLIAPPAIVVDVGVGFERGENRKVEDDEWGNGLADWEEGLMGFGLGFDR